VLHNVPVNPDQLPLRVDRQAHGFKGYLVTKYTHYFLVLCRRRRSGSGQKKLDRGKNPIYAIDSPMKDLVSSAVGKAWPPLSAQKKAVSSDSRPPLPAARYRGGLFFANSLYLQVALHEGATLSGKGE